MIFGLHHGMIQAEDEDLKEKELTEYFKSNLWFRFLARIVFPFVDDKTSLPRLQFSTMGICHLVGASFMLGTWELTKCCALWEMTGMDTIITEHTDDTIFADTEYTDYIGYGKAGQMMITVCTLSIITIAIVPVIFIVFVVLDKSGMLERLRA